jgi:hypothetical protein
MLHKALVLLGRHEEADAVLPHEYAARYASGVPEWMPQDTDGNVTDLTIRRHAYSKRGKWRTTPKPRHR